VNASDSEASVAKLETFPKPLFESSAYLFPGSDVVAHLVLAHQTQMHNLITLTNYKTRLAVYAQASQAKAAGTPSDAPLSDSSRQQFERPAEQLLRYMLFANETPLPGTDRQRIIESSAFAREFAARGVRDPQGRSLRDFDLRTRIFRYPCSYLIYSEAFDTLPGPAKGYVYHRLLEILSGQDQSRDFANLSPEDRRAVLEILLATKPRLPEKWREYAKSKHVRVAGRPLPKQYGVKYTYLIAGAPSEMWEKVPQAVNLNTWPATIFVGRDGLVKGVHSGFASPASGEFNSQLREQFTAKIEQLLAEKHASNLALSAVSAANSGRGT